MNSILAEYLEVHKQITLEDMRSEFESIVRTIGRFKEITPNTQILEIGTGTGWFQILAKERAMTCKGLEVNPYLIKYAQQLGKRHGILPDLEMGSIETTDIGTSKYDIIIATSTFEHVENWQRGLERSFNALKPGGLFFFYSTNKFSFRSGEYWFPLYGWLPDSWRYHLRRALQAKDIMEWGIDFNQFTSSKLRRFFKDLGFSRVLDRIEVLDSDNLNNPTFAKRMALKTLKKFKVLKHPVLFFSSGTLFICMK